MSSVIRNFVAPASAALLIATPALANAQTAFRTGSPVNITSFQVNEAFDPGTTGGDAQGAPRFVPSSVAVKFVNTSTVAIKSVTFVVNDGTHQQSIVDKGTFSPGVSIAHVFAVANGVDALPGATCKIAEVDFADGGSWDGGAQVANGAGR